VTENLFIINSFMWVAPAPGEYENSEEENCYRKGIHIHRQGLWPLRDRPVHPSGRAPLDIIPQFSNYS